MSTQQTPRRSLRSVLAPRATLGQLYVGLLCLLLGVGLVAQLRQTRTDSLNSLRETDLLRIMDDLNAQSARLTQEETSLTTQRDSLRNGSAAAARDAARQQADALAILAGTMAATGPGVVLKLTDPNQTLRSVDLLDCVQELRDAGAEAIQIGDQRVVAQTAITQGTKGTIYVNGIQQQTPLTVLAIGDATGMRTALQIPGGVIAAFTSTGVRATLEAKAVVVVDAVHSAPSGQYAQSDQARPTATPTP